MLEQKAAVERKEDDEEKYTKMAKKMTEALLEATDLLGGIPWTLVHEKRGISLFRADSVSLHVPCNVHAVCKVAGEIEDVAESMVTKTTDEYKRMMSLLSSDFLDGAVVQNIIESTEENPYRYVGLKWMAFKSTSSFTKDRDFVILEYVDMIVREHGEKIVFRILESVDVPSDSPFAETSKYTRDIVPLMGFMYHTTKKPNELRMTYTCNFDKNGDLPAWAANSAIQSHVEKCINGNLKYIESFRQRKETIVLPQQVLPMSEQDYCSICERHFGVLRRKHNCLKCGQVICSSCSSLRNTQVPEMGERQLRVCTACVIQARRNSRSSSNDSTKSMEELSSQFENPTATPKRQALHRRASCDSNVASSVKPSYHKRRSYDNVLEPVRSRLMEHTTFSSTSGPETVVVPKTSFHFRSLSDGLTKGKDTLLGGKRRGSPADLAISLEAFRLHQQSESNESIDHQAEEASVRTRSSLVRSEESPRRRLLRAKAKGQLDRQQQSPGRAHQDASAGFNPSKDKLAAAMERAQGIIHATEFANHLAQEARKISMSFPSAVDSHVTAEVNNQNQKETSDWYKSNAGSSRDGKLLKRRQSVNPAEVLDLGGLTL